MLDLIGGLLFARWLGRRADEKGYPRGDFLFMGLGLYVACDVLAVFVGLKLFGLYGALVGLIGGALGASIAAAIINAKPHRARTAQEEGRSGPASTGTQLVGSSCVGCGERIASLLGAERCEHCLGAVHSDCAASHRDENHAGMPA